MDIPIISGVNRVRYARSDDSRLPGVSMNLHPKGTTRFGVNGVPVAVGDTGVSVTVRDFIEADPFQTIYSERLRVHYPSVVPDGAAHVTGSPLADRIDVYQNTDGDTVLDVATNGRDGSLILGRIVALDIDGDAGDDVIRITTDNYFGGIRVQSGAGADSVDVTARQTWWNGITIDAGLGDDSLHVGGENAMVRIDGGDGIDVLDVGDLIAGTATWAELCGGTGMDVLFGSAGHDVMYGDDGIDALYGFGGNDQLYGGPGGDLLVGGAGNDFLSGDDGDDTLQGGAQNDQLRGGMGDDLLYAGSGQDSLTGGWGNNVFAPWLSDPESYFVQSRNGALITVAWHRENRVQSAVTSINEYTKQQKLLTDFDAASSVIADRAYLL
ncbi:MAG: calcium-binding protein [Spartobacteria bacterium]|nr:calcium-binding protein [Spartobacteria bacterium]